MSTDSMLVTMYRFSLPSPSQLTHSLCSVPPFFTEMDPLVESPATSSSHIHSPCFSVYELRNKVFSESNAVYAYTYKNQIKTLKPPLHWVILHDSTYNYALSSCTLNRNYTLSSYYTLCRKYIKTSSLYRIAKGV